MKTQRIAFTEWSPDKPDLEAGAFDICENAMPGARGYEAGYRWEAYGTSDVFLNGGDTLTGVFPYRGNIGKSFLFLGSKNKLHAAYEGGVGEFQYATVGPTAGAYTADTDADCWQFCEFGNNVIATNYANVTQWMNAATVSNTFETLATSGGTIRARTVAPSRNFLIAGNMIDDDGTTPNRVRWSALGDERDWTVSPVTQADYNDLDVSGGAIKRIFGGENPVVFQEQAIHRMTYVGPPLVWQFDQIVAGTGLAAINGAAQVDNKIFYYAPEGFHVLVDASRSTPIGYNKVDRWFKARINLPSVNLEKYITATIDPFRHLVYWANNGTSDEVLVYDYEQNRWGTITLTTTSNKFLTHYFWGDNTTYSWSTKTLGLAFVESPSTKMLMYRENKTKTNAENSKVGVAKAELSPGRNALITNAVVGRSINRDKAYATTGASTKTIVNVVGYPNLWTDASGATSSATASGTAGAIARRLSVRKNGRCHDVVVEWDRNTTTDADEVTFVDVEYAETHRR